MIKEFANPLSNRTDGMIMTVMGISTNLALTTPAQAGIQFSCPS